MANKSRGSWFKWFADGDSPRERKLITKLDLLIVPYAVLAYWVKYMDQSNLNNAYVSGMKEDLKFEGNELVKLQTFYVVGAVTGQIPLMFLLTYIPMHWLIPALDILWGAAFFPAVNYLLGAWYRGDELARRGGIFYIGLYLGTLTAGLIQAGASAQLDDVHGLAGWRWMYIICAIITIPIGILGYFVIPGTPEQPNRVCLSQEDIDLSTERLSRAGHQSHGKLGLNTLKRIAMKPQFWTIILLDVLFWNSQLHTSSGSFLLWIKSLERYTKARINELGTIAPALGIFYVLLVSFASDLYLGPAWAITAAYTWNIIGLIILIVWSVPEAAKWFAFSTIYSANAMAPALHGWVNTQLRTSPAERSFALVLITAIAQSSTAWTPLLVYKTVEAPHFIKGFSFSLGCSVALVIATHLLNQYLKRRDPQTVDPAAQVAVEEAAVSPDLKSASAKETERDGLSS
ncbi:Hypothetical protein NCS54_00814000 [Fusarium falciforme]|uniref:Hypothetical protein n=1 Tax=Fusarium falciforme TaxID=195108 RepID=UPI00230068D8|nr:Hypothetical protein NCS54_00814000 [Fusarium falciforme]WAO90703.1 Hypothetical protein NCS54_00814000 [Fusarium falciforme]